MNSEVRNFCRIYSIVYTCKASKIKLHQSTAVSTWWCGPQSRLDWVKKAVGLPKGPSYPGHSPHTNHFLPCSPLNNRRRVARSLFKIGLSSLFSCLSLARLLILLLLLIGGNIHPNSCPVSPYSVCAGNFTFLITLFFLIKNLFFFYCFLCCPWISCRGLQVIWLNYLTEQIYSLRSSYLTQDRS